MMPSIRNTGAIYAVARLPVQAAPKFNVGTPVRVKAGAYRSLPAKVSTFYHDGNGAILYRLENSIIWYKEQALEPVPPPPPHVGFLGWALILFSVYLACKTIGFLFFSC